MPPNTVYVGRPTQWGNEYSVGDDYPWAEGEHKCTLDDVIFLFETDMKTMQYAFPETWDEFIAPLRGKDLACWCSLDKPCHADVLLKMANA